MTEIQKAMFGNARRTADGMIATVECLTGRLPDEVRMLMRAASMSAQMGAVTQVAQFDANTRAEIARLDEKEVVATCTRMAQ